jgi:hypothetical protein
MSGEPAKTSTTVNVDKEAISELDD